MVWATAFLLESLRVKVTLSTRDFSRQVLCAAALGLLHHGLPGVDAARANLGAERRNQRDQVPDPRSASFHVLSRRKHGFHFHSTLTHLVQLKGVPRKSGPDPFAGNDL